MDRSSIVKKIRELRVDSDSIVLRIPDSGGADDMLFCLAAIKKFKFKNLYYEVSYEGAGNLGFLKKKREGRIIYRLENDTFELLKNDPSYLRLKLGKKFALHLRLGSWGDLDILKGLEGLSRALDCDKVIISIKTKADMELPYVQNAVPLIYDLLNDGNLEVRLLNIDTKYFRTEVALNMEELHIEPNNTCNLRCSFCLTGMGLIRPRPDMSFAFFKKIIDQFPDPPACVHLYGRGEPLLNRDVFRMIEYLKERKGVRAVISTNGQLLSRENILKLVKSGVDRVFISVDSLAKNDYEQLRRGGDFDLLMRNIQEFSGIKRKLLRAPDVYVQFIISKDNEGQIPLMKKLAENLGFAVEFRCLCTSRKQLLPLNQDYRMGEKINSLAVRPVMNFCNAPWRTMAVACDGEVVSCCKLISALGARSRPDAVDIKIGDLSRNKLMDVWNGPAYRSLRKQMLVDKHRIKYCKRKCPDTYYHSLTRRISGGQSNDTHDPVYTF